MALIGIYVHVYQMQKHSGLIQSGSELVNQTATDIKSLQYNKMLKTAWLSTIFHLIDWKYK